MNKEHKGLSLWFFGRRLPSRQAVSDYLAIKDENDGVPRDAGGLPDFKYVATPIRDSIKRRLVGGQMFVARLLPFRAELCAYSSHCLVSFQLAGCIPLRAPVGPASGWASIIGFDRGPMNA